MNFHVFYILRSLTSLLYVIHVCKGSLTSSLIHCILCFMWVRILSSLLHVMHVCRGANLASFPSWMYIAYISLLLICFSPFFDDWQKGREWFWVYMHILSLCLYKMGRRILKVYSKRGRRFLICMFLSPCFCIYICLVLCTSLNIYLFIVMHELKGSFYEA